MKEIEIAIDQDNLQEATQLCDELLANNAYDLTGLYFKAIIKRKLKNFQEAIGYHNTLINLIPDNADYYAERGLTYHMMDAMEEALNDFSKAVELDAENGYRYASRAFIRDYYADHNGAMEDYYKAIELDPNDAIALNNLGVLEEKLGRYERAKQNFDRSDSITGLEKALKQAASTSTPPTPSNSSIEPQKASASPIKHFFSTLRSLFRSAEERQAFLKFLLKRK